MKNAGNWIKKYWNLNENELRVAIKNVLKPENELVSDVLTFEEIRLVVRLIKVRCSKDAVYYSKS